MSTIAVSAAARAATARRNDRLFYTGMAVAFALTVFVGFARSYFLKAYFGTPALPPLRHFHGLIFTTWIVLLVAQTTLVAARRTDIHRRLGVAGVLLAAVMIVVGAITAIDAARRGAAPPGIDPLAFLIVPFGDMFVFGVLVGAAVWLRRKGEAHKRLMLVATMSLLTAAIARMPGVLALGPLAFFGFTDLFVLAGVAYDLYSRRRVHPAYIWGGLLLVLSQPLRVIASSTDVWMSFAAAIVR
jgi:hypothetical protein